MRKPNFVKPQPIQQQTSSIHYFMLAVMLLTACSIALSGCSKIGLQDYSATDFDPIPQPKSLTERQQRSIEKSLAEQDAQRASATESQTAFDESKAEFGEQKKEIVAEAARRADADNLSEQNSLILDPALAQVSFETELEQNENEDSVRLLAKKDDFEGVPKNVARQDMDFSRANFLRPSFESDNTTNTEKTVATKAQPKPFGDAESLRLPLQPMLFNPKTRTTLSSYEGTLRPLAPRDQELEADVAIESKSNADTFGDLKQGIAAAAGSLQPLSPQMSEATIKLKSQQTTEDTAVTNSRLLQPIEKQETEVAKLDQPAPPINTEVQTVEASTTPTDPVPTKPIPSEPIIVSENIVVVESESPAVEDENQFRPQPVAENAQFNNTEPDESQNSFIPAEVIADAEALADDLKHEFAATAIPTESSDTNEFKVQPVSNTTITSVCRGCGSESCSGCDIDRGEPMFTNNDFAAPATPGGDFVAPMAVPPATIPQVMPEQVAPATANFGTPVNLDAPSENEAPIARIAALPVANTTYEPSTSGSSVPPVGISTLMDLNAVTWKSRLDEAIELAEARLNRISQPPASSKVNVRLLKALRSQMEHVEEAPAAEGNLAENESQYWHHQLEAITAMLETPTGENQAVTDYRRHQAAHETLAHLRNAIAQLESIASLKVSSGQFCTEINGFGQFRPFPTNSFDSGQKTLVYCEVENYTAEKNETATGNDFRTRLRGSFAVYDTNGKVVQQAEFPSVDDVARKRRRDFYMYMPVTIGDLPAGEYVLHALVEDVYGKKTASLDPPLNFSVK